MPRSFDDFAGVRREVVPAEAEMRAGTLSIRAAGDITRAPANFSCEVSFHGVFQFLANESRTVFQSPAHSGKGGRQRSSFWSPHCCLSRIFEGMLFVRYGIARQALEPQI